MRVVHRKLIVFYFWPNNQKPHFKIQMISSDNMRGIFENLFLSNSATPKTFRYQEHKIDREVVPVSGIKAIADLQ